MNPGEGAAVGHLVVEGKHAVWWKGAWIGGRIEVGVHGAVVVHCRAQQVRAAREGAGLLRVECLWMARGRFTGVSEVSVTAGTQPFHVGEEVWSSRGPRRDDRLP